MLSCNIYIITVTVRSARIRTSGKGSRSSVSRHRQLSLMLMLVTFTFVLLTLPSCIYFVFFRHRMSSTSAHRTYRHMVQICLNSVQFTSHAINFFLYCFSATNFRKELKDFIGEICFCRTIQIQSNKSSMTTMKLTTFSKDYRNRKMSSLETPMEYQNLFNDVSKKLMDHQQDRICDKQSSST